MYIVKIKGAGVKLAGKWRFKGDVVEITNEEYEENKDYVEIIEKIIENPITPESTDTKEEKENNTNNIIDNDEEIEKLKIEAQNLGITIMHNMKKETIIKKIEEAKIALSSLEGE